MKEEFVMKNCKKFYLEVEDSKVGYVPRPAFYKDVEEKSAEK